MTENQTEEVLKNISKRIGEASAYAFEAHQLNEIDIACDWEKIANDYTYLGRAIARNSWHSKAIEAETQELDDRFNMMTTVMDLVYDHIMNGDL